MTGLFKRNVMSGNTIISDIVELCLKLDILASKFYCKLSKTSTDKKLIAFWYKMAGEERKHVKFWQDTLDIAQNSILPQIFENPIKIKNDVRKALRKSRAIFKTSKCSGDDVIGSFADAFRLELYGVHPALAPLFDIMKAVSTIENPGDSYDKHISYFLSMFVKYSKNTHPEMRLLGETIQRLWVDNRRLAALCHTDELTKLLNRRGFFSIVLPMMELAKRNNYCIGIIIADIDNFKKINDSFGHQTGDKILAAIPSAFKSVFRASDIICRYGGDEFIVFCPELSSGTIHLLADRFRKSVEKIKIDNVNLSISAGALEFIPAKERSCENELDRAIKAADELLYDSKESGKNTISERTIK